MSKKKTTYFREDGSIEKIEEVEYDDLDLKSDPVYPIPSRPKPTIPDWPIGTQPPYYPDFLPKIYCGGISADTDPSASKYVVWNTESERDCGA